MATQNPTDKSKGKPTDWKIIAQVSIALAVFIMILAFVGWLAHDTPGYSTSCLHNVLEAIYFVCAGPMFILIAALGLYQLNLVKNQTDQIKRQTSIMQQTLDAFRDKEAKECADKCLEIIQELDKLYKQGNSPPEKSDVYGILMRLNYIAAECLNDSVDSDKVRYHVGDLYCKAVKKCYGAKPNKIQSRFNQIDELYHKWLPPEQDTMRQKLEDVNNALSANKSLESAAPLADSDTS